MYWFYTKGWLEYLIDCGLVKASEPQNFMNGTTIYVLRPTYEGLHYDEFKNEIEEKQIQNVMNIYNNYNNDKVNINSTDNSINITNDVEIFEKLLESVKQLNNQELIDVIKEMKEAKNTDKFTEKYKKFFEIVNVVKGAMELISPFIPMLTKWL